MRLLQNARFLMHTRGATPAVRYLYILAAGFVAGYVFKMLERVSS